jgi:hypothetical protein
LVGFTLRDPTPPGGGDGEGGSIGSGGWSAQNVRSAAMIRAVSGRRTIFSGLGRFLATLHSIPIAHITTTEIGIAIAFCEVRIAIATGNIRISVSLDITF